MHDPVNHPSHYTSGKIEVIDYIEDQKFPYHLGNAVKYISRAGKKDPAKTIEDLSKAVWYLNRYIGLLEKEKRMDHDTFCRALEHAVDEALPPGYRATVEKERDILSVTADTGDVSLVYHIHSDYTRYVKGERFDAIVADVADGLLASLSSYGRGEEV